MGLALVSSVEREDVGEVDDEQSPRDSGVFRRVSPRTPRVTGKMVMPPEISDETLMQRFQDGDRSAFTALVRRHQGKLYNFTLRTLRSPQLAEDVTQETFVRVVHRSSDFRGSSKFSTWLHAIARNLCIDELRKAKHRRHASLDAPAHGSADGEDGARPLGEEIASKGQEPERATGGNELKDRIARAVDLLPDDQREVFLLREISHLPFAEIAEIVKVPEPTVKSRMRYALERLQAALAEYEEFRSRLEVTVRRTHAKPDRPRPTQTDPRPTDPFPPAMDCKTFDDHLLDELYGELDEVTRAAMAKHAESCGSSPSCGAKLAGLRGTREAFTDAMPYVDPPDDLEDRILAATRDARPVVPLRRKMGGAVSWAGAWAMRPQTAMAAVFLLMIGSSLAFLRTHRSKSESSKAVAVSELGTPAGAAAAAPTLQDESAAVAAATPPPAAAAAAPMATSVPQAANGGFGAGGSAAGDGAKDKEEVAAMHQRGAPSVLGAASAMAMNGLDKSAVPVVPPSAPATEGRLDDRYASADAPSDSKKSAVASRSALKPSTRDLSSASGGAAYKGDGNDSPAAAPAEPPGGMSPAAQAAVSDDSFTRGQQAYAARRFDEARADFDAAAGGNVAAALWAARSVRDGSGCGPAVSRFDDVVSRAPSSTVGFDARLEGARCYRALGQTESARARLVPLLTVPSHASRAQAELAAMAPPAAAAPARKTKPSGGSGGGL